MPPLPLKTSPRSLPAPTRSRRYVRPSSTSAVRGKLVEQDPANDEPAAVLLLKRIAVERARETILRRRINPAPREILSRNWCSYEPPFNLPSGWSEWSRISEMRYFSPSTAHQQSPPPSELKAFPCLLWEQYPERLSRLAQNLRKEDSGHLGGRTSRIDNLKQFENLLYNRTNECRTCGKDRHLCLGKDDCRTFASYLIRDHAGFP